MQQTQATHTEAIGLFLFCIVRRGHSLYLRILCFFVHQILNLRLYFLSAQAKLCNQNPFCIRQIPHTHNNPPLNQFKQP